MVMAFASHETMRKMHGSVRIGILNGVFFYFEFFYSALNILMTFAMTTKWPIPRILFAFEKEFYALIV